jgi:hypothetical protein
MERSERAYVPRREADRFIAQSCKQLRSPPCPPHLADACRKVLRGALPQARVTLGDIPAALHDRTA